MSDIRGGSEKQIPRCAPFLRQGKREDIRF